MEEDCLLLSRKNPRNLGFLRERKHGGGGGGGGGGSRITSNNKSMPVELNPKLPSPILDRFRVLVNEREEELRVSKDEDDDDLRISKEDIVRIYDIVLSELTFNSKPIITDLTVIAGEQRDCAAGIVDVICNRIMEVSAEQKLPCLYLLDSIVKNNENVYVKYFASRIHEVFCEAYKQVHPNQHPAMHHLFGTWSANSAVFPPSVLRQIANELQFFTPVDHQSPGSTALRSSETTSPHPDHGIHVNPKYLEARCQFEHATVDVQHGRGISSSLRIFGKKPTLGYGEIDAGHNEIFSSHVRIRNINSSRIEACTSSIRGTERIHHSKKRHSNPSRLMPAGSLSPSDDGFVIYNSPGRASPSHCGLEYGTDRVSGRDGKRSDWWMEHRLDNNRQHVETSTTYNPGDGDNQQRPRALIDAYGHYGGKNCLNDKSLKVERLDVNSINSEANTRSWQDTEEEEYFWEDMSPTGLGRSVCALVEPDLRRGNWPRQGMVSVVDDSAITAEDGLSILGPGRGFIGKDAVDGPQTQQKATIQGSPYWQEPWNLPGHSSHAFQQLNRKESGRVAQMPFGATGTAPSASQRLLSLIDNTSNQRQGAHLQSEFLKPQGGREGFVPSIPAQLSSHLVAPPLSHGHTPQGFGAAPVTKSLNHIPGLPFSASTVRNIPNTSSFQSSVGSLSPLPPGSSISSSHMQSTSHIMGSNASQPPQRSGLSGLISSLRTQGLISLTTNPMQGSDLLEFDPEALKVRHESAIAAIYDDLPRQCTSCGLRFKGQEEHSSHMDWHVTRNRTSGKQKGSRKSFVSSSLWISGLAGVGTDLPGLLPTEAFGEKKSDEEMAVLADEDQNTCALCGESFDNFYSDETEEWMYRGAVYMNALDGSTTGVDRSLLGPIVHAKCRSGSSVTTLEGFAQDEMGMTDEDSQRKRMRV